MANLKDLFMQIDDNPAGDYDDSSIEVYADSVKQALELAARELDIDISQLDYEVVEKGTKGFLGFGRLPYRVIITPLRMDTSEHHDLEELGILIDGIGTVKEAPLGLKGKQSRDKSGEAKDYGHRFCRLRSRSRCS